MSRSRGSLQRGESGLCQTVHGGALDQAIGDIVIEVMTPLAIEVALTVQQELANRHEEAEPRENLLECHPSPELPQALEKMGFVRQRERGRHAVFRRQAPHASRLVITKGLGREAIDAVWNALTIEEQQEIERAFLDNAPELLRERYLAAQKEGGKRFELARRELIDGYVQRAARAMKRNAGPVC